MTKTVTMLVLMLGAVVSEAYGQQPPPPPKVQPFNDGAEWVVLEPFTYVIGNTKFSITVPAGFVTDFASIPAIARPWLSPTGQPGRAAIFHDYLYWRQECSKAEADRILLLAMIESGVGQFVQGVVYGAVIGFGGSAWEQNKIERSAGWPRIIPTDQLKNIGALDVWPKYRQSLIKNTVALDALSATRPTYCEAALTVKVPTP